MPLQVPPQVTFHQVDHSDTAAADILGRIAELEEVHDAMIDCRVVVEREHVQRGGEGPIAVRFEIHLPGGKTVVGSGLGSSLDTATDLETAVKLGFEAVKRQLHDHSDKRRRHTKVHEVPPHGVVISIDPAGDFGFLRTSDELDVYFHRNAVLSGSIDDLQPGDAIRFVLHAEEGLQGPQASSVQLIGKHHLPDVEVVRS